MTSLATSAALEATPEVDLPGIRRAVDACLNDFLDEQARAAATHRLPLEVTRALRGFLSSGGKRLRPVLCVLGWHAGAGHQETTGVIRVAAALEMFHAFALIHDDLMDHSDIRRGEATVHRALAAHHCRDRGREDSERLGENAAILVGDVALAWSDGLLHTADVLPERLVAVLLLIDAMRTEVMYGQYLDVTATGELSGDVEAALKIARYKTAKYTVEWPLHIGAALAGSTPTLRSALSDYALPLGEAFQLRDDLLGVFGDPAHTGKSALEDLRGGKHTVLLAYALQQARPAQQAVLHALVGNPDLDEDGAQRVREVLEETGARAIVEHMIQARYDQAQCALNRAPFPSAATAALADLADTAVVRTS